MSRRKKGDAEVTVRIRALHFEASGSPEAISAALRGLVRGLDPELLKVAASTGAELPLVDSADPFCDGCGHPRSSHVGLDADGRPNGDVGDGMCTALDDPNDTDTLCGCDVFEVL